MKTWFSKPALVVVAGMACLGLFQNLAVASITQSPAVEVPAPQPVLVVPVETDFTDAEFETADRPDLGKLPGGEVLIVEGHEHHGEGRGHGGDDGGGVIVVGSVTVVVVLVVILLILL